MAVAINLLNALTPSGSAAYNEKTYLPLSLVPLFFLIHIRKQCQSVLIDNVNANRNFSYWLSSLKCKVCSHKDVSLRYRCSSGSTSNTYRERTESQVCRPNLSSHFSSDQQPKSAESCPPAVQQRRKGTLAGQFPVQLYPDLHPFTILMAIVSIHEDAKANIFEHNTLAPRRKCICRYRHFQDNTSQTTRFSPPMVPGTDLHDGCTERA